MKIAVTALAVFACIAPASVLAADDPFVQEKATLQLTGLNLATANGQQRLNIRIDQAARMVCGDGLDRVHLLTGAKARACHKDVVANIRQQIETRLAGTTPATLVQLASAH